MKCDKCLRKIEDEYMKVPARDSAGQIDYCAEPGGKRKNPNFLYYHRECYKQKVSKVNKVGSA